MTTQAQITALEATLAIAAAQAAELTPDTAVLAAPVLTSVAIATGGNLLKWTMPATATVVQIFRNGASVGKGSPGVQWLDNTVPGAGTYAYTMTCFDALGNESPLSNTESVTWISGTS